MRGEETHAYQPNMRQDTWADEGCGLKYLNFEGFDGGRGLTSDFYNELVHAPNSSYAMHMSRFHPHQIKARRILGYARSACS